jgi:hypothetical protein
MILLDDCDEEEDVVVVVAVAVAVVVVVVVENDDVAVDGLGMMQQALSSSLPNRSDD